MIKTNKRIYFVFALVVIFLILVHGVYFSRIYSSVQILKDTCSMNDNWNCTVSSGTYYSLSLPFHLENSPDNIMTMVHLLPDSIREHDALYFRSSQQAVRVFVDDSLIYEYNCPGNRITGRASPSHWNFVSLKPSYSGKTLRIQLTTPYRRFSGRASYVFLGNSILLSSDLLKRFVPGYVSSLILMFFGMIIIFTSYIFRREKPGILNFRYLGFFTVLLAIWMRSETKMPDFFMSNPHIESLIGFCALLLCPLPYICFIKHRFSLKVNRVLNILFYIYCANFIICILLQFLEIVDLAESFISIPILVIITLVITCSQYLLQIIHQTKKYYIFSIFAFIALLFSIASELLVLLFENYEFSGYGFRIGMTIYLICMTFSAVQAIIANEMLSSQKSEQLLRSQIRMMLSHIQPHFLFNSLGAIQVLIKKSPDTAYQMLYDFSKYLRASINAWNNPDLIPFSLEVENLKAFTNIQLIRFQNNFRVDYEINAVDFSVPLLSIRALVENAVNYGARKSKNAMPYVMIRSYNTSEYSVIEVIDNGPGFDVEEKLFSSELTSGLHRCEQLLSSQLNATMNIYSTLGKGTTIVIHIPH